MKEIRLLSLLVIATTTTCVSPVYNTAKTTPGVTSGVGLTGQFANAQESTAFLCSRGEVFIQYAPRSWFSLVGRVGIIACFDTSGSVGDYDNPLIGFSPWFFLMPVAGAGVKFSTAYENWNFALGIEAEYPRIITVTPMLGIGWNNREYVTVGLQTCLYYPMAGFITVHPCDNWHVFAGLGWFNEEDFDALLDISIGVAYTWSLPRKEREEEQRTLQ